MGTIVITWDFSPRVRGKDLRHLGNVQPFGITPACAGKRLVYVSAPVLSQDHPRMCGEKSI